MIERFFIYKTFPIENKTHFFKSKPIFIFKKALNYTLLTNHCIGFLLQCLYYFVYLKSTKISIGK